MVNHTILYLVLYILVGNVVIPSENEQISFFHMVLLPLVLKRTLNFFAKFRHLNGIQCTQVITNSVTLITVEKEENHF